MRISGNFRVATLLAAAVLPFCAACATVEPRVAASDTSMPSLDGDAAIDAYVRKLEKLAEAHPPEPVPMVLPPPMASPRPLLRTVRASPIWPWRRIRPTRLS